MMDRSMDRPDESGERLEPWMEAEVVQAMSPDDASIPVERMWTRVAQAPRLLEAGASAARIEVAPLASPTPTAQRSRWLASALIAAGVLVGVAIGRFALPGAMSPSSSDTVAATPAPAADRLTSSTPAPTVAAAPVPSPTSAPTPVAPSTRGARGMTITPVVAEHLQQTVVVLAAVRDAEHLTDADSATRRELQQLLTTTRQLLDEPGARASRTHRLLQDLELVLAQLARARMAAPATRAAADEALRETNLLPRLRAAADMRSGSEEP